ncbi:ABC transporter substrate-binding protein [Maridesulfovibrio sp.]|uniref:ABC transporter substrate-binding protein n=1 Tax=Maridesulfovibrio sp. TaxID=2795000 RepID=UPI002A18B4E6|nr:ABC transporter substrate-binding protein [Maridesulfovibrio sp.]
MKTFLRLIIALLVLSSPAMAADITIGTVFEISGPNQATAQEAMNGALLAVKQINGAKRGINVKLEMRSTSGQPEDVLKTINSFQEIKGLSAVTGLISDDAAMNAAPAMQAADTTFLCTGAQTDGLAQSAGNCIFTLAVPDIRIGQLLADFAANTIQTGNIALIRSDLSDSCARQADSFARRFKHNGGKIMTEMRITEQNADLGFIAAKLKDLIPPPPSNSTVTEDALGASDFDDDGAVIITGKRDQSPAPPMVETVVIFAPAHMAAAVMKMLQKNDLVYRTIGGSSFDTVTMCSTINNWPGTVFYAAQAALTREDPLVDDFVQKYTNLFGSAPQTGYSAMGFDSVMLLADAAEKGGPESKSLRTALNGITDFSGVSGKISFHERAASKPLYIMQSQSGQISLAAEVD